MIDIHETDDIVLQQGRHVQMFWRIRPVANHHVELPAGKRLLKIVTGPQRVNHHAGLRCLPAHLLAHTRQKYGGQIIRATNFEQVLCGEGLERLASREQAVNAIQSNTGRLQYFQPTRRWHHGIATAHQQFVFEDQSKFSQCRTDGGLRLVHAGCHSCQVLLGQERDQNAQ